MIDKTPTDHRDDDSSQQPRQQHTPTAIERKSAAVEDRIKEREQLSEKKKANKRS